MATVPDALMNYACVAATMFGEADLRISPRRVRQVVRNLLAVSAVTGRSFQERILR